MIAGESGSSSAPTIGNPGRCLATKDSYASGKGAKSSKPDWRDKVAGKRPNGGRPMKLGSFDSLVRALEEAGVRYLVADGLAVNAHGYLRFTKDVDLVLQLTPENIIAAFAALENIGYRPLVPVTAAEFANAAMRNEWIRDKGMTVLNFWCDRHRETPIDVFVTEPFAFDEEYARALVKPLGSIALRFVSIPSLIRMKEIAGRPQDKIDIEYLRKLADASE